MISTRPDWVLSRQRAWGVPLTCFVKKGLASNDQNFILKDQKVNALISSVFKTEGADAWFKKGAKERFLADRYNPDDYEQVCDILDVWFDSGSTDACVLHKPTASAMTITSQDTNESSLIFVRNTGTDLDSAGNCFSCKTCSRTRKLVEETVA